MESLAQVVWQQLTNPNVSFVLLVLGVWAVALAVSAPGTGVPEGAAVVCLALAAVGLLRLPVSLLGLGLIALALALFIIEFQVQSHGALLAAGSLALAVGALFLYRVGDRSAAPLSWATVIGAPLASGLLFAYLIRKGLAAQRAPVAQDLGRLIGAAGVTRTEVGREGTVYVLGELWSATSDRRIPPETDVIVTGRKGLTLTVTPAALAGRAATPAGEARTGG
jgi:membrane-bound serine protease (ClpP class)